MTIKTADIQGVGQFSFEPLFAGKSTVTVSQDGAAGRPGQGAIAKPARTFPIVDANRTAPSPVIFPQIADGGGFVTEFILLNAGGASKTTLSFFDNEGRQLAVGK